jgi:hypothetical protein
MKKAAQIPNQVFIGLPWKTIKPKYESAVDSLVRSYPLSFIIVGRDDKQDAEDLLTVIKSQIESSSYGIFDATSGNANVSLEYGHADAVGLKCALYISTRKRTPSGREHSIISDLAGKRRNHWNSQKSLLSLLEKFCDAHPYTIRFERFLRDTSGRATKGAKRRRRALALKIVHELDGKQSARRDDIVQALLADPSRYDEAEVDKMILKMHQKKLIVSQKGRYSTVFIN